MLTGAEKSTVPMTRVAVALLLLVGLGIQVVVPSPAEAATRRYHYFQFNACDNLCQSKATSPERADAILASLDDWSNGYLFASLNELCRNTATDIVNMAQAQGLNIGGHFTQTSAVAANCSNGSFGNMVMHPGARVDVGETILQYDNTSEVRKLTCVSTTQPGQLRMCTTHITGSSQLTVYRCRRSGCRVAARRGGHGVEVFR